LLKPWKKPGFLAEGRAIAKPNSRLVNVGFLQFIYICYYFQLFVSVCKELVQAALRLDPPQPPFKRGEPIMLGLVAQTQPTIYLYLLLFPAVCFCL